MKNKIWVGLRTMLLSSHFLVVSLSCNCTTDKGKDIPTLN